MVDESGNLGTSETYFVLAMFNTTQRQKMKRILKKFQNKYTDNKEIKGSMLGFQEKQTLINSMKDIDYRIHYIVTNKTKTKLFQNNVDKNIIYNYLLTLIVVKVIKENMSQDKLVFHLDNHTIKVKSLNSFAEHIKLKAIENDYFGQIEVNYYDSQKHILIQYADIISNTVWNKFERKREHLYNLFQAKIKTNYKFPLSTFN
jgi:hypothetical protein